MRGEIHRLQPGIAEIVNVLDGHAEFAKKPVVPQSTATSSRLSCTSVSMPSIGYCSALSKAERVFPPPLYWRRDERISGFGHGVFLHLSRRGGNVPTPSRLVSASQSTTMPTECLRHIPARRINRLSSRSCRCNTQRASVLLTAHSAVSQHNGRRYRQARTGARYRARE